MCYASWLVDRQFSILKMDLHTTIVPSIFASICCCVIVTDARPIPPPRLLNFGGWLSPWSWLVTVWRDSWDGRGGCTTVCVVLSPTNGRHRGLSARGGACRRPGDRLEGELGWEGRLHDCLCRAVWRPCRRQPPPDVAGVPPQSAHSHPAGLFCQVVAAPNHGGPGTDHRGAR